MKSLAKTLVHWMLVVVMAGQALSAVAAPCGAATEWPGENAADVHAGHTMANEDSADPHAGHGNVDAEMNCCEGGYCSANGCFSLPAIAVASFPLMGVSRVVTPITAIPSFQSEVRSSLYRPPAVA